MFDIQILSDIIKSHWILVNKGIIILLHCYVFHATVT